MGYNIKLKTRLTVSDPRMCCNPAQVFETIRRGASKVFSRYIGDLSAIEQVTFAFKDRELKWFNMFDYFFITRDAKVLDEKVYYIRNAEGKFIPQEYDVGADFPTGVTVFELSNEPTDIWQIDDHFNYDETLGTVRFRLSPQETAAFEPSDPDDLEDRVEFEIDIRRNTVDDPDAVNKDTYDVIPQSPILVLDSLYSNFIGVTSSETVTALMVSENTYCSEDLYVRN